MQLQNDLAEAIDLREQKSARAQKRRKIQALRRLETCAKELGFSLTELMNGEGKLRRRRRSTINNAALDAQGQDDR